MDTPSLTAVIDYWKDYEPQTVLLAYAELKKRNFQISEQLQKKQTEFCLKYGYDSMDSYLAEFFNKHEEYKQSFDTKQIQSKQSTGPSIMINSPIVDSDRYPVLRGIAVFYKIMAVVVAVIAVCATGKWAVEENYLLCTASFISGLFLTISFAAVSEGIEVFLDIEYNTRKTSLKP